MQNQGIGLVGLLTIIFVIAKITGYITWSWWWVFSPVWIGFACSMLFLAVIFGLPILIGLIAVLFDR